MPSVKEPIRSIQLQGVHAYAQKWIPAGSDIELKVSSDVPYKLTLVRLGGDTDSPKLDEVVVDYGNQGFPAIKQVIRPGSLLEIFPGLPSNQNLEVLAIEGWIRIYDGSQSIWRGVVTQHSYPTNCGLGLFLSPEDRLNFYGGAGIGYTPECSVTSALSVPRNRWCHIAAVFDGIQRTVTFYLTQEGKDTQVEEQYVPAMASILPAPVQMRIGAYGSDGQTNQFLDGDVAMPSVHLRKLTLYDVKARAASADTPVSGASVWGCWPLTEGNGEIAHDVSGQNHHAIAVNTPAWRVSPPFDPVLRGRDPHLISDSDLMSRDRPPALRLTSDDLADCTWETTHTISVALDARPGIYVARLGYDNNQIYDVTIVVAPGPLATPAQTAVIANTSTWLAYNSQPFTVTENSKSGEVLYGIDGPVDARVRQGPTYSCYARHAAGQPGTLFRTRVPWPAARPYIYYGRIESVGGSQTKGMEGRLYSHLLRAERFTHVWLDQQNCAFDTLPDLLVDSDPDILSGYRTVVVCGHAEYWSDRMLDAVRKYLDNGGNLVVLSGNTLNWRVTHNHLVGLMECRKFALLGNDAAAYVRREDSIHQLDGQVGGLPRAHGREVHDVMGLECAGVFGVERLYSFKLTGNSHEILEKPERIDVTNPGWFAIASVNHETDTLYTSPPEGMTVLASCTIAGAPVLNYDASAFVASTEPISLITFWNRPAGGCVFYVGSIVAGMALSVTDQTNSGPQPRLAQLLRNVLTRFGSLPSQLPDRYWVGDFSHNNRSQILAHASATKEWWMGDLSNDTFHWSQIGSTSGFGTVADGRSFWIGDFKGSGRTDILFYYPGDGNWWLGSHNGNSLSWSFAGNTSGFQPPVQEHPACQTITNEIGGLQRERAALQEELQHAAPGEKPSIISQIRGLNTQIAERKQALEACLTTHLPQQLPAYPNFGNLTDGRPFWIGNFSGSGRTDIMFYYPVDQNWWLGNLTGGQFQWSLIGNGFYPDFTDTSKKADK